MPEAKQKFESVADYVASLPPDVQRVLAKVRQAVRRAAPGGVERISYQIIAYDRDGANVVHVAGYKNHIGVYPAPAGTKAFQKELAPYKAAKATVRFPLDKPIPHDLLTQIVAFRIKETADDRKRKAAAKKK